MARPALIAAFTLPFAIAALPLIAVFATNTSNPANDAVTYVPAPITVADEGEAWAQKPGVTIGYEDALDCDDARDAS